MRIRFRRSGGFAGAVLDATIETDDLPESQRKELERLLRSADLLHLPSAPRLSGADQFQYEIEITGEGSRQAVSLGERHLTDRARRLVDRLEELARGNG